MTTPHRFAAHTAYTDPGRHAALLREPVGIEEVCRTAGNLILHYRAESNLLREDRKHEVNARWVSVILELDQQRHPGSLLAPRPPGDRVPGCCRDHSLFTVAALREQGIPARTRVGFAGYFGPGFHSDHVVVEWWQGSRWQRSDPELQQQDHPFDVFDLAVGEGAPFPTAAEVWTGYRQGRLDPERYGVFPGSEHVGPPFIKRYVFLEVNHRYGNELLLWDEVGTGVSDEETDRIAALSIKADAGDEGAETELEQRFRGDTRLWPTGTVTQLSPYGEPPVTVDLTRAAAPSGVAG
ncbi:transglutaminase-like domain-containing protein [Microlunatus sp. GCM10028923]|uniref:transglutaminase-like domain-containing protein n=1 Tax=Microlunatus sp. GCM10028923 TaxID=3273400 RepID=UPI003605D73B